MKINRRQALQSYAKEGTAMSILACDSFDRTGNWIASKRAIFSFQQLQSVPPMGRTFAILTRRSSARILLVTILAFAGIFDLLF
jgi:hypothetical protein